MLGWWIGVFRQAHGGSAPADADTEPGSRLAVWQTGWGGLDWLAELVKDGHAIDLGGNGYPSRFTAQCEQLRAQIEGGPPNANSVWAAGVDDIIGPAWLGKTTIDKHAFDNCSADEWLLVEAWDES